MKETFWKRLFAGTSADGASATNMFETKLAALEAQIAALTEAKKPADGDSESNSQIREAVEQLRQAIRTLAARIPEGNAQTIVGQAMARIYAERPWVDSIYLPQIGIAPHGPGPYMAWSTCSAADFLTQEYVNFCAEIRAPCSYHRKNWEWAFIVHHLRRLRMTAPGKRGLVFGVGTEPLPSLFAAAGATIVATDAQQEHAVAAGWTLNSEFASNLEDIRMPEIIGAERFAELVSYATCDMNNIDTAFKNFDFCWSSCCFEHLGSLEAGMDFVINSVEATLKIGGIACHTTEFNLSSNGATVESGPTVIYRKRDIEQLVKRLRDRGHEVDTFNVAPDHHPLDFTIDVPPHWRGPHLRLNMLGYTVTSAGLVIRRGR